ncbi:ATP-dependent nuclease [Brachyspira murdochii]|uniref:SMC domain protein n=1 Tax=Brachyspira murdochii (strain ATCC 51284 / DSM 12563 / 56-150) TaxID=526224 RepID=D5UB99_BRAM5|nr:AAA family ATPase [Brachyspira murdochii]ADG71972.1 SMC domain protein [Brachyspira murdochii DSM 12563]
MYIRELIITNYKNIKNVKIDLQHEYSMIYLTGENGIGKSNIIDIIFKLFTYKKNLFEKEDFYKNEEKIEIEIKLELETNEIFKDYLYRDNNKYFMKIVYKQYSSNDEYEWFYKNLTEEYKLLNNILTNFICYKYSPREFDNNFMFNKSNRIGKFLSKIIENQIKKYQNDDNKLQKLLKENYENCKNELNEIFKPIFNKPNQELKLNIEIDDEIKFLLKLFELVHYHNDDNKLYLNQLGRGRGYYLYPFIDFLAFLYDKINNTKSQGFNTNIIILFDEPEVFLSPFLQRQFMDHWLSIFNNNQDYEIINNIINIITDNNNDEINYNITPIFFVSTHSAHIIPHLELNEKKNILSIQRLYYDKENNVKVASLDKYEAKLKQFMIFDRNILEGLFAKKIILVEGDTEIGFLPSCLNANGINIHQEHIYIIKAAPNNFPSLAKIFSKLQIKTYILTDRDCKNKDIKEQRNNKIYQTYVNKEYGYVNKRVYNLYESIKNCNNVKIFVSDYWDFEESILVCLKNHFKKIYISISKSNSNDKDKLTEKVQDENLDEEFTKKLLYMRKKHKNINDNYKLIKKIIKENLKLEQDEYKNEEKIDFGNMNSEAIKNAAEENYKLPKYIIDLIKELKNGK